MDTPQPKFPLDVLGEWPVAQVTYVCDAEGKCWHGSPRGWCRMRGDRQEVMAQIGTVFKGQHAKPGTKRLR